MSTSTINNVKLIWITPNAERLIAYMARVSNQKNQNCDSVNGLLKYCIKHGHWSIFEMANMCLEIETTRDISAQIMRHRSFSFSEFSQRYAEALDIAPTHVRRQDKKNRQNSIDDLDESIQKAFYLANEQLKEQQLKVYQWALDNNIAKECARRVLPMATKTKVYMNGSIRSWMHYFNLRCDKATQLEHREVACASRDIFREHLPNIGALL